MKFKTAYTRNDFPKASTPSGSAFEPVYIMEYDKNGHKFLKQNGFTNIQERIQANLESTKIENIIRRCTDPGTLMAKMTQFIDATNMPKNLYEVQNTILRMKEEFGRLNPEIRAKFNNSPEEYAMTYGSEKWMAALNIKRENTAATTAAAEEKKGE